MPYMPRAPLRWKRQNQNSAQELKSMAKTPDEEQYPCLHANVGHHTTSLGAESGNKSNLNSRTSYFGDVLALAFKIVFRFEGRKRGPETF